MQTVGVTPGDPLDDRDLELGAVRAPRLAALLGALDAVRARAGMADGFLVVGVPPCR